MLKLVIHNKSDSEPRSYYGYCEPPGVEAPGIQSPHYSYIVCFETDTIGSDDAATVKYEPQLYGFIGRKLGDQIDVRSQKKVKVGGNNDDGTVLDAKVEDKGNGQYLEIKEAPATRPKVTAKSGTVKIRCVSGPARENIVIGLALRFVDDRDDRYSAVAAMKYKGGEYTFTPKQKLHIKSGTATKHSTAEVPSGLDHDKPISIELQSNKPVISIYQDDQGVFSHDGPHSAPYTAPLGHSVSLEADDSLAGIDPLKNRSGTVRDAARQVLDGRRDRVNLGGNRFETLKTLHNVAYDLRTHGRYDEAEKLYSWVFQQRKEALQWKNPETLQTAQQLAMVYEYQRRYDDALELLKEVLKYRQTVLGPKHRDTMSTKHHLGVIYRCYERYDDAETLLRHVYEERKRSLGKYHFDTLESGYELAVVCFYQDRYDEAYQLCKTVMKGENWQLTSQALNILQNLAGIYEQDGEYEDARDLFQVLEVTREKKLGHNHRDTQYARESFQRISYQLDEMDEMDEMEDWY